MISSTTLNPDTVFNYYHRLPETERAVLGLSLGFDGRERNSLEIAVELNLPKPEAERRHDRAVGLLVKALGGAEEGDEFEAMVDELMECLVAANMRGAAADA